MTDSNDSTHINYNPDLQQRLLQGIEILSRAVGVTLGPGGKNVILEGLTGIPHVTKDGVTVANHVWHEDPVVEMGIEIAREAALRTGRDVGDGTTTATVLAHALTSEALNALSLGHKPSEVKKGMIWALEKAVEYLEQMAIPVTIDSNLLKNVAEVSSNGNEQVASIVTEAYRAVGAHGLVLVSPSESNSDRLQLLNGMTFERGMESDLFINDPKAKAVVFDAGANVLLCEDKIESVQEQLLPILEKAEVNVKPLLIICTDIDPNVLGVLASNAKNGALKIAVVRAPLFGDRQAEALRDIALYTGGTVLSTKDGRKIESFTVADLGYVKSTKLDKKQTVIFDGKGDKALISSRIDELSTRLEKSESETEREFIRGQVAKLAGGIAVIHTGGHTKAEMAERKDLIDDAVYAVRAALEKGVLPGGGTALVRVKYHIREEVRKVEASKAFMDGYLSVYYALEMPLKTIVSNLDDDIDAVLATVKKSEGTFGYDGRTATILDLRDVGVVDPLKVTTQALQTAVTIAVTILTSGCSINRRRDEHGHIA